MNANNKQEGDKEKPHPVNAELQDSIDQRKKKLNQIEHFINQTSQSNQKNKKIGIDDFEVIGFIGKGAFGVVQLAMLKTNRHKQYAMKVIKKIDLMKFQILDASKLEKEIMLAGLKHPNIVQLKYCFQTNSKIYYVMEYVGGGELYQYIKNYGRFDEHQTKFIVAQVVLAISFLHSEQKLIYRDLKPENILLATNGYIKLADFGLSKRYKDKDDLNYTMAGTKEYIAPEVLFSKGYNKDCDLWAIGIFCFELLHGRCPFPYKNDQEEQFKYLVRMNQPPFSKNLSHEAVDFMRKMLVEDPKKRLGS